MADGTMAAVRYDRPADYERFLLAGAHRHVKASRRGPERSTDILPALGLTALSPRSAVTPVLAETRMREATGLKLFSLTPEVDLRLEHSGGLGLAYVSHGQDAAADDLRAVLITPSGQRPAVRWSAGDRVTGVVFDVVLLHRQLSRTQSASAQGLYDLSGRGATRAAALSRLLDFFVAEAAFSWSLFDAPAGRDHLEAALFGLLAEATLNPVRLESAEAPAPRHLRRAEAYIRENLASELSAEDLARIAGVSARSLYRAFNDFRGMSIRAFVQNARMEEARRCLTERPDTPLTEVARQVGYSDYTSFWRHYRSRYGNAPSSKLR